MNNLQKTASLSTSIVSKIIGNKVGFDFKPTFEFYNKIQINQKRFGMICKNKVSPTIDELKAICQYFNADLKEFI